MKNAEKANSAQKIPKLEAENGITFWSDEKRRKGRLHFPEREEKNEKEIYKKRKQMEKKKTQRKKREAFCNVQ